MTHHQTSKLRLVGVRRPIESGDRFAFRMAIGELHMCVEFQFQNMWLKLCCRIYLVRCCRGFEFDFRAQKGV